MRSLPRCSAGLLLVACGALHAYDVTGGVIVDANGSGPLFNDYGPVDAASGAVADLSTDYAPGPLTINSSAQSHAEGSLSATVGAVSSINVSGFGNASASWTGSFVNTLATSRAYVVSLLLAGSTSSSTSEPTGGWVPPYWPDNVDAAAHAATHIGLSIGGSFVDLSGMSGLHSFSLGTLAPGQSIDIALSLSASADANGGQRYVCESIDPGPDDCHMFTGDASANADVRATLTGIAAVPEPEAWMLMLTGLALLGAFGIRQREARC
jgi:hypothetical protein